MKLKKILALVMLSVMASGATNAQTDKLRILLDSMIKSSPLLSSAEAYYQWRNEAAKTGMISSDPHISYSYLQGPAGAGRNSELQITQDFDFPTAYANKYAISKGQQKLAVAEFELRKAELKEELFQWMIERNALIQELQVYDELFKDSKSAYEAGEKLLSEGMNNQLELNAANRLMLRAQAESDIKRQRLAEAERKLDLICGNKEHFLKALDQYSETLVKISEMADIPMNSPAEALSLSVQAQRSQIAKKEVDLARSRSLPSFTLGYRQDYGEGQNFRGIVSGISIPLFANAHQVKATRKASSYEESVYRQQQKEKEVEWNLLHQQWKMLSDQERSYASFLEQQNSELLLKKSLNLGRITVLDWIREREKCLDDRLRLIDLQTKKHQLLGKLLLWK